VKKRVCTALATLLGTCRFELVLDLIGFFEYSVEVFMILFALFDFYFCLCHFIF